MNLSAGERNKGNIAGRPPGAGDEFKIKLPLNHTAMCLSQAGLYRLLNSLAGTPEPPRRVPPQRVKLQDTIIGIARSIHHTISNLVCAWGGNKGGRQRENDG